VPEFAAVVRSMRDEHGAGVLLIDHNMALIMEICDRSTCSTRAPRSRRVRPQRSGPTSTSRRRTSASAGGRGMTALALEALDVRYGGVHAVRSLSFEVRRERSSA